MERTPDPIVGLKAVAYLTIAGVFMALALEKTPNLPLWAAGFAVFVALLPYPRWATHLSFEVLFTLFLVEGLLVAVGLFLLPRTWPLAVLFFVLLPGSARLPRPYSLLCSLLFPLAAILPTILGPPEKQDWAAVLTQLPGFLAIVAFSEAYWYHRRIAQENQKLLDELIATQKQLYPGHRPAVPAEDLNLLTRRDREVLALVAKGFSNKEISERLYLAEGTVKNRVSAILDKIGARDRTQAALAARELNLL